MAVYVRRIFLFLGLLTACLYVQLRNESSLSSAMTQVGVEESEAEAEEEVVQKKVTVTDAHVFRHTYNVTKRRKHPNSPEWTDKFPFFPDEDEVDSSKRVCFVHVGKTAGSTLACNLGFQYPACGNRFEIIPGELPKHTTNIIHTRFDTCKRTEISVYLFALRDPLSRMQSWFTYERPADENSPQYEVKKRLFIDCGYNTLNELGEAIGNNATLCSRRAYRAVTGMVAYSRHNKFNYGYYYQQVPEGARIAAIRTEHLEEDWNSLEVQLFDGTPLNATAGYFKRRNRSDKLDADLLLSVDSRLNLCKALCQEVQIYKKLLRAAENLTSEMVKASLAELKSSCPFQARSDRC